jgi:hypothetical protein
MLFSQQFISDGNLVAQHHFLVHYASYTAGAEPACRYWCICVIEQNMSCLKNLPLISRMNAKQLPWPIRKHQCIMCNTGKKTLNANELDVRSETVVTYADIISAKLVIYKISEGFMCRKVAVYGIVYCLQDFVTVGLDCKETFKYEPACC